jgi:hypothetical protein
VETCLEAAGQAEWLTRENSDILGTQHSLFQAAFSSLHQFCYIVVIWKRKETQFAGGVCDSENWYRTCHWSPISPLEDVSNFWFQTVCNSCCAPIQKGELQ